MNLGEMMEAVRGFAKREWWLIALVTAAAVVAASLIGGGPKTTFRAQATFVADTTSIITKYKGVPTPDDVVRDVGGAEIKAALPAGSSVSESEAGKVRLSGFGNPQNRLQVTYSSPDKAQALEVIQAADKAVLDYVAKRTELERANYQKAVDQADAALAELEPATTAKGLDAYQRADLQFKAWQVRQARVTAQDIVDVISSVYHLSGEPTVTEASTATSLASRAFAGGLAGLVVALLLAAAREFVLRRGRGAGAK